MRNYDVAPLLLLFVLFSSVGALASENLDAKGSEEALRTPDSPQRSNRDDVVNPHGYVPAIKEVALNNADYLMYQKGVEGSAASFKWLSERWKEIQKAEKSFCVDEKPFCVGSALATISSYNSQLGKWTGSFSFGFSGESTVTNSEDTLLTGEISAKRNSVRNYRHETKMNLKFRVQDDESGIEEDFTNLLISHDVYFSKKIEGFGFIELTDIDELLIERWEMGFGAKREWSFGERHALQGVRRLLNLPQWKLSGRNQSLRRTRSQVQNRWLKQLGAAYAELYGAQRKADNAKAAEQPVYRAKSALARLSESGIKAVCMPASAELPCAAAFDKHFGGALDYLANKEFREGYERANSRLNLSISTAILAELTNGRVEVEGQDDTPFAGQSFSVDVRSDYVPVWSLRPKLQLRISEAIDLEAAFYYKKRLRDSRNERVDRNNFYTNSIVSLTYDLKKVKLTLSYERFYDNAPYTVTAMQLDAQDGISEINEGIRIFTQDQSLIEPSFSNLTAPSRFERFSAKVSIPL